MQSTPRFRKPTLRTIAERCNISIPSVSRALRDAPDISAATKETVRRVAEEIGYVPNRAGIRLRTGQTNVISFLLPPSSDYLCHTGRIITAIATSLEQEGYTLTVTNCPEDGGLAGLQTLVQAGSVDGVILNQITPGDARIAYLKSCGVPFVTHGRSDESDTHAWFDYDNTAFARLSCERLASRHRKHCLAVLPPDAFSYTQHLKQGLDQSALRITIADGVTSHAPARNVASLCSEILSKDRSIDAVFVPTTAGAMALATLLVHRGFRIGHDIDIVTKDATAFVHACCPDVIVMREDLDIAGAFMASALIDMIRSPEAERRQGLQILSKDDFLG